MPSAQRSIPERPREAHASLAPPEHRPTVLYVEDHPVNRLLMEALFARRPGLRLVVANDGQSALRVAETLNPALIMLDLGLPDCHGSHLLANLRRMPALSNIPAVAVTADDLFDADGTGFLEVWLKPLDLAAVLRRVDELVVGSAVSRAVTG